MSRAPDELQSPHTHRGWSASKYVEWVDCTAGKSDGADQENSGSHTLVRPAALDPAFSVRAEAAVWETICQCLDAYSQRANARGEQVHEIYGVFRESEVLLGQYEALQKAGNNGGDVSLPV
jgi:hypothetical protein